MKTLTHLFFLVLIFSGCSNQTKPEWFTDSLDVIKSKAEAGDSYYMAAYAEVLRGGEFGVIINEVAAKQWAVKSADAGSPVGKYNLWFLLQDDSMIPGFIEGIKQLADEGCPRAQNNLGFLYHEGKGVSQNYNEAVKWFLKASEKGIAETELGFMYLIGRGVPEDAKEAAKWFTKAANNGHAGAIYQLGIIYREGKGIPIDFISACSRFEISALKGVPGASESRDSIMMEMSPEQITKAQELSKQLLKEVRAQN
jgi:TPR repeat protein